METGDIGTVLKLWEIQTLLAIVQRKLGTQSQRVWRGILAKQFGAFYRRVVALLLGVNLLFPAHSKIRK